jgi:hypothetical protein
MIASALVIVVGSLILITWLRFDESHRRLAEAMRDLEVAERFTAHVKRDLARAREVRVEPGTLRLGLEGGETTYRFDPQEGSVFRTGPEPAREYRYAFESVTFESDVNGVVSATVELRKRDPASPTRATWRSTACWRKP